MVIEFRDATNRWVHPVYEHGHGRKRPLDELHSTPWEGEIEIREQLAAALESGEAVSVKGSYNARRYKVLREVAGTFVLVNAKGGMR